MTAVWYDAEASSRSKGTITGMEGEVGAVGSMCHDLVRRFSQRGEVLQQHVVLADGQITRVEERADFVPVPMRP
ncbi:hypothetical protein [Herbidospora daliensis]|uniref:hypothetical protein n=1 Tax=Herbidospora daliensis TaxID=295585 RepID=UPI0012F84CCC|nr:hypothetical protein [Herbidospora daliensis]